MKWIDALKETPECFRHVLLRCNTASKLTRHIVGYFSNDGNYYSANGESLPSDVIYWQELTEPDLF